MAEKSDLSKATTHPLRVKILERLEIRMASPNELSKQLHAPLGNVSYHVKTLLELGTIELVKTEPRRGAVEHFYRSTNIVSPSGDLNLSPRERKTILRVIDDLVPDGSNPVLSDDERADLASIQGKVQALMPKPKQDEEQPPLAA
jgi:DNA-binding transcriptional ArsR family regulator